MIDMNRASQTTSGGENKNYLDVKVKITEYVLDLLEAYRRYALDRFSTTFESGNVPKLAVLKNSFKEINFVKAIYEVGKIVEDGKNKMRLENTIRVENDRNALDMMRDGRNYVRRLRCDKNGNVIDEAWYDPKTGTWV